MSDPGRLLGLADAMAAALNAAQPAPPAVSPFVRSFTAARQIVPLVDLAKLGADLLVHLIAIGATEDRQGGLTAGVFTGEYEVDVLVQQRLGAGVVGDAADAQSAALLLLLEQIRDFFKVGQLTLGSCRALLTKVDASPAYSLKTLLEKRCFVGVQTLTFKVIG